MQKTVLIDQNIQVRTQLAAEILLSMLESLELLEKSLGEEVTRKHNSEVSGIRTRKFNGPEQPQADPNLIRLTIEGRGSILEMHLPGLEQGTRKVCCQEIHRCIFFFP